MDSKDYVILQHWPLWKKLQTRVLANQRALFRNFQQKIWKFTIRILEKNLFNSATERILSVCFRQGEQPLCPLDFNEFWAANDLKVTYTYTPVSRKWTVFLNWILLLDKCATDYAGKSTDCIVYNDTSVDWSCDIQMDCIMWYMTFNSPIKLQP